MTYANKRIIAQIHRFGKKANVLKKEASGENAFGNTEHSVTFTHSVLAFQTYPNRNTQVESGVGDLNQDRPVFMVPVGEDQPEPPQEEDHIVYDGKEYEVKSHTEYDTHIEFFGAPIVH